MTAGGRQCGPCQDSICRVYGRRARKNRPMVNNRPFHSLRPWHHHNRSRHEERRCCGSKRPRAHTHTHTHTQCSTIRHDDVWVPATLQDLGTFPATTACRDCSCCNRDLRRNTHTHTHTEVRHTDNKTETHKVYRYTWELNGNFETTFFSFQIDFVTLQQPLIYSYDQ